jgi:hypothetical protein
MTRIDGDAVRSSHPIGSSARLHAAEVVAAPTRVRSLCPVFRPSPSSWLALAALTACRTAPPTLDLPPLPLQVTYSSTASSTSTPTNAADPTLRVTIERFAVRPGLSGPAVDLAATAIAGDRGRPFRGASSLPAGSRWLAGEWLTGWQRGAGERQSRGLVDALVAADLQPTVTAGPDLPALELSATAGGAVQVTVIAAAAHGGHERLLLHPPLAVDAGGLLFVPVVPQSGYGGDALLVTLQGPAAAAHADAVRAAAAPAPIVAAPPPDWHHAERAIGEHNRRPALLALARERGSALCLDLLLVADEPALIASTAALARLPDADRAAAWPFERAVLQALLPRLERDELSPALQAALRRQLGALANDAGSLRLLLAESADRAAFARGLRDENFAALADRSVALRVEAHDWLQHHGGGVPGFDPLAAAALRRQVLRAHTAAMAAAAAIAAEQALETGR